MLIGIFLGFGTVWFLNKFFWKPKEKRIDEFTQYRFDLCDELISFIKNPPPEKEWEEWINIARYCDQLYFSAVGPIGKNFERLEETAKKIFKQIKASR